jgi:hypothetical protein
MMAAEAAGKAGTKPATKVTTPEASEAPAETGATEAAATEVARSKTATAEVATSEAATAEVAAASKPARTTGERICRNGGASQCNDRSQDDHFA